MAAAGALQTFRGGIEVTNSLETQHNSVNNGAQLDVSHTEGRIATNGTIDYPTPNSVAVENLDSQILDLAGIFCHYPGLAALLSSRGDCKIEDNYLPDTKAGKVVSGFINIPFLAQKTGKSQHTIEQLHAWADQVKEIHPEIAGHLPPNITGKNADEEATRIAKLIISKNRKRRFHFAPLGEVLTRPDPEFLVHRLLIAGGTSLLTAKHASFKSFFALDIALCIATGRLWHGYEVRRGPVVYVAAEGATGLKLRAAAWLSHHNQDTPKDFIVLDVPFHIHESSQRADFIKDLGDLKPALIVLDTLARCAIGLDENNARDMGAFADSVGDLARETGTHILVVHHNNKGGEYRGSSAVPAAVDTHISMERRGDNVTLKTEKQKDGEELPTLIFEKIVVPIPYTKGEKHSLVFHRLNTRAGGRGAMSDIEQRTFDALLETYGSDEVSSTQWKRAAAEQKSMPESTFAKACRGLLEKKAVLMVAGEKGGKGNNAPRYQVAPEWAPASPKPEPDNAEGAGEENEDAPGE